MMDLDELRSAQSRERQASQLQHLRDGFYEEAASFIRGLRTERKRATERSTYDFPYDDPEVQRLTNEIQTAEEVVESLYERRVGKVVKMASFDAAGMAVDAEGLTAEESDLFETLVGDIEANRARVLDALAGGSGGDGGSASSTPGDTETTTDTTASPTEPRGEAAATPDEPVTAPDEAAEAPDEPVHIGSGPAADGPVSTADGDGHGADQAPEAAAGSGSGNGPEAAHDGSAGGGRGPPPSSDDSMDAASAMGGDGTGRSDEVPGGVPDGEAPSGVADADAPSGVADTGSGSTETTRAPGTAETAGASGAETDDPVGDHQPVPPADGPPGTGSGSRPTTDPDWGDATTPAPGDDGGTAEAAGPTTDAAAAPEEGTVAPGTAAGGGAGDASAPEAASPTAEADAAGAGVDEPSTGTLVRVTADVGEIFGVDGRSYDLAAGDVAVLPPDNASVLVGDGDAERLQSAVPFSSNRS